MPASWRILYVNLIIYISPALLSHQFFTSDCGILALDDEELKEMTTFRRTEFESESYLHTLRSACTTGIGSIALTALHDPLTAHLEDPFIKDVIDSLSNRNKTRFLNAMSSKQGYNFETASGYY